jgi:hypothetical protein
VKYRMRGMGEEEWKIRGRKRKEKIRGKGRKSNWREKKDMRREEQVNGGVEVTCLTQRNYVSAERGQRGGGGGEVTTFGIIRQKCDRILPP